MPEEWKSRQIIIFWWVDAQEIPGGKPEVWLALPSELCLMTLSRVEFLMLAPCNGGKIKLGLENSNIMLPFLKISKSQSSRAKAKALGMCLPNLDRQGQSQMCLEGPGWSLEWPVIGRRPWGVCVKRLDSRLTKGSTVPLLSVFPGTAWAGESIWGKK